MNIQPAEPCILVVFGASGDLFKRLLLPALYNLAERGLLSQRFALVGIGRSQISSQAFQQQAAENLQRYSATAIDAHVWERLSANFHYLDGSFEEQTTYEHLVELLTEVDLRSKTGGNYLFYLATAPDYFGTIVQRLATNSLTTEKEGHWRRVIIEKPFGRDLASARALNASIRSVLTEQQIYRIDHYLGKETVQNILVLRFANGLFEPLWNRSHIDHVQITVAESVGVEQRGGYYDHTGALRDMVPNHLFQLLALIAMEPPTCFGADSVRAEKTKLLGAVLIPKTNEVHNRVIRSQYTAGTVGDHTVAAYRDTPKVDINSSTETFVAMKLLIDNWRWSGVPFYLRTGKAMNQRTSEIAIRFKQAPYAMFRDTPVEQLTPNFLVLHIQPQERIALHFGAKLPGPKVQIANAAMDFCYKNRFGKTASVGYETLIYDCMVGDATLFQRSDTVEAGWSIVEPMLEAWELSPQICSTYEAGSWGPPEADALLARDGRQWREIGS